MEMSSQASGNNMAAMVSKLSNVPMPTKCTASLSYSDKCSAAALSPAPDRSSVGEPVPTAAATRT